MTNHTSTIAIAAALFGCGAPEAPTASRPDSRSEPIRCDEIPAGLAERMQPGAITIFGEMHGTAEVPQLVGDVACVASRSAPVLLGLEIPSEVEPSIRAFLVSDGGPVAKQELTKDRFWKVRDGRSSEAMLGLIDRMRRLKRAGRRVIVFTFDGAFASDETRDAGMAANIVNRLRAASQEDSVTLILTGNLHARTDSERWMGWHVSKAFPQTRSLDNAYSGGTAWFCSMDGGCGPGELNGRDRGAERFVEIVDAPNERGYHGVFYLGAVTASPPAIGSGADVATRPASPSVRSRANAAYESKSYAECADLFVKAATTASSRQAMNDLYNAACCFALAGQPKSAFDQLAAAIANGYSDVEHLERDPDLASLHDRPRWKDIVDATRARETARLAGSNAELARIYHEDQADRAAGPDGIDWSKVTPRDERRRARVIEILDAGGAKVSIDYYHAAMVFQHGDSVEDYEKAHELAVKAVELDDTNDSAKWLAAAALDRYLMNQGKPQRYGTQFHKVDGTWVLYEVDPDVTDAERAKWNVPPLAEARRRARELNAK